MRELKEIQEKLFSDYLEYDKIEREKLALLALERQFKIVAVFATGKME